jgi:ketosteroid isomerase-like protein
MDAIEEGRVQSMNEEVTLEALRKFVEAFNSHDADAVMEFFADDSAYITPRGPNPWGKRLEGKEKVREGVVSRFKGLPDVHFGEDSHWLMGDKAVSRWTMTGTSPSGEKLQVNGVDLLEFRKGKIIVKDSYWKIVLFQTLPHLFSIYHSNADSNAHNQVGSKNETDRNANPNC